ncbi:MAG: molybdopterin molybdotransferase MoeA [Gaiellaceae bacterium]
MSPRIIVIVMDELPGIDEALARVLDRVRPLGDEDVPVGHAAGRVLAVDARAAVDLPPFDSSAMDGYAVRARDTPGRLEITGQSAAGHPASDRLEPGCAAVISTGAVVPGGADAVVPVERTALDGAYVQVDEVSPGTHVRPRGGDVRAGAVVVEAGVRLGPPQVAALAASGASVARCTRTPRVFVLATGSELRAPGETLRPGEIYESNATLLSAQVASAGALAEVSPAVADDADATRDALARGLGFDVLITSGGVSVGPHDLVRAALAELGAEEVLWRVAVKPGKPIAFAVAGRTLVFGLPGNPVSALVGFELFVRPALDALQGLRDPGPHYLAGRLTRAVRRNDGRDELLRARVRVAEGGPALEPLDGQESHMIVRAASADALVLVPSGRGELAAGAPVRYIRIA